MKILLPFLFVYSFMFGQNKIITPQTPIKQLFYISDQETVRSLFNPLENKFNKFVLVLNAQVVFHKKEFTSDKAYFNKNQLLYNKNEKVAFSEFYPNITNKGFSLPLRYKYKNGSPCFYLLKNRKE